MFKLAETEISHTLHGLLEGRTPLGCSSDDNTNLDGRPDAYEAIIEIEFVH